MSALSFDQLALREHMLPDDQVSDAEDIFPGVIRIMLATREKARLMACGEVWEFKLAYSSAPDAEDGEKVLQCQTARNIRRQDVANESDWDLIWHRAAEAMIAVRQGHSEARLAAAKRKELKEQKKKGRA